MLTERELMELNDRIMAHIGLVEKYRMYAQQCPDPQVRDVVTRHQQVLQNHFQMMTGFVQNAQSLQSVSNVQAQWGVS